MENKGQIIIYESEKNQAQIEVKLENDTVWLSQAQMAELFGKSRTTITEHINNIFLEHELRENSVCRNFRHTGPDGKLYSTLFYNLDLIISVGYRVNSKRGTQFRIWATKVLKDHIIKGFTVNQRRLDDLQASLQLIKKAAQDNLNLEEAQGLLNVITDYTNTWVLLNKYDEQELTSQGTAKVIRQLEYEEARKAIDQLMEKLKSMNEAGDLFGLERGDSFKGILNSINQKFAGEDLYPSIEEKAANLLYLIIKDHPFSDGNKRIGSMMFIYFVEMNKFLFKDNGERKINDNALTALALLVAISEPKEKDQMISLITNLL